MTLQDIRCMLRAALMSLCHRVLQDWFKQCNTPNRGTPSILTLAVSLKEQLEQVYSNYYINMHKYTYLTIHYLLLMSYIQSPTDIDTLPCAVFMLVQE